MKRNREVSETITIPAGRSIARICGQVDTRTIQRIMETEAPLGGALDAINKVLDGKGVVSKTLRDNNGRIYRFLYIDRDGESVETVIYISNLGREARYEIGTPQAYLNKWREVEF